tara:strand:- start:1791 stop:2312 length:522 start_codon:yes stop_codon:yes gene_type:complete
MKKLLTEWRKYLQEMATSDKGFPAKVYYGTSIENLPVIRDNGIVNLPTDSEIEQDKMGIPTCSNPQDAKSFGNVVLEIDGEYLEGTMQYESYPNSKGCRVRMRDSAVSSGSGVDDMVDTLGTNIPFDAVKNIIFTGTPNLNQMKEAGFANVQISSFPAEEGEIKSLYKPQQED